MNESDVYIYIFYGQFGGMFQLAMLVFIWHLWVLGGQIDSVAFDSATELRCVFFGSHFRDQSQGCGGRPPNVKKSKKLCVSKYIFNIAQIVSSINCSIFWKTQSWIHRCHSLDCALKKTPSWRSENGHGMSCKSFCQVKEWNAGKVAVLIFGFISTV